VFYVDGTNGNDANNGAIGAPVKTIADAITLCTSSSLSYTIYITPGGYSENLTIRSVPRISFIGLTNDTYQSRGVTLNGVAGAPVITYDPSGGGALSTYITAFENMIINTQGLDSCVLFDGGGSAAQLLFKNVTITASGDPPLSLTSLIRTINTGSSRLSLSNCNISAGILTDTPLVDISGNTALYLLENCVLSGNTDLLAIRTTTASAFQILNSSFVQAGDASLFTSDSQVFPSTTITGCSFNQLDPSNNAVSPLISLNTLVVSAISPFTIRNSQFISSTDVSYTQHIIDLSDVNNVIYLEKNLFGSSANPLTSYVVNGSSTDSVTYSANTIGGLVGNPDIPGSNIYNPAIGTLTALTLDSPTKTFIIDHPIDSSRYLVHGCVEGPEVGVYYRGKATILPTTTITTIRLPPYVPVFAKDFTVQLTPLHTPGQPAAVYTTTEVVDGQFTVYGPPGSFFWHVHGSRGTLTTEPLKSTVTIKGDGPYRYIV
jgi:hypothetical protein